MLPSVDGRLEAIAGPVLGVYSSYRAEMSAPGRCYIALGVIAGTGRRQLVWSDATVDTIKYNQELRIDNSGASFAAYDTASTSAGRAAVIAGGSGAGTVIAGCVVTAVAQSIRIGGLNDVLYPWSGAWACAVYAAKPSDAKVRAVLRWLARRYGIAPPT